MSKKKTDYESQKESYEKVKESFRRQKKDCEDFETRRTRPLRLFGWVGIFFMGIFVIGATEFFGPGWMLGLIMFGGTVFAVFIFIEVGGKLLKEEDEREYRNKEYNKEHSNGLEYEQGKEEGFELGYEKGLIDQGIERVNLNNKEMYKEGLEELVKKQEELRVTKEKEELDRSHKNQQGFSTNTYREIFKSVLGFLWLGFQGLVIIFLLIFVFTIIF
jgi:hypothetical protein